MATSVGASGVTGAWKNEYVAAGTEGPDSPNWGGPAVAGVPGQVGNPTAEVGATVPTDIGGAYTDDNSWLFGASVPVSNYDAQGDPVTGVGAGLENPGLDVYDSDNYRDYAPSSADLAYMADVHANGGSGRDSSTHAFKPQNMKPYLEHQMMDETDNYATFTPAGQNNDFHGPNARTARDDFRMTEYSGCEWLDFQQQYAERPLYPNVAAQGMVPSTDTGLYIPDTRTSSYGGYETVLPDPYQESPDPAVNTAPTPAGAPMDLGF
jgi:hypothetical protein